MAERPQPLICHGPADLEAFLRATFATDPVPRNALFAALGIHTPVERNILIGALGNGPYPIHIIAHVLWERSNYAERPDHPLPRTPVLPGKPEPGCSAQANSPAASIRHPHPPLAPAAARGSNDGIVRIGLLVKLAGQLAHRLSEVDPETPESAALVGAWRRFAAKGGRP